MVPRQPGLRVLTARRLAVWGDPIDHSLSPRLHAAAYAELGYDWEYERRRVDEAAFAATLAGLSPAWRGLSLTMPLKSVAFRTAVRRDRRAQLTRAVNTLLFTPHGPRGFNTDVGGIVASLGDAGVDGVGTARIVGTGATATSALVALGEMGARDVFVVARRPEAAAALAAVGSELGVRVRGAALEGPHPDVELTIATLPGEADIDPAVADALARAGGPLLDVVYGTWPTPLAVAWQARGQSAVSGLGMLLHQALLQVRVFAAGDPDARLPDEDAVLAAMRRAIMGD
ncbi:shikimate dehydrogenase [Microbacterium sp. NPDC089189]|uniref:shikimate dehydrogenase n=1 Tax=Microbacterium sp. NPDC089189 TaxID=3154972 RepID=UPI003440E998